MSSLSSYSANKVLDLLVGRTAFGLPTAYAAFFNGDPRTSGVEVETPGVDGYSRTALGTGGSCKFDAATASAITTNTAISAGPNTGAGSWTVNYLGIMDASSGGNVLLAFPITAQTVATNETYTLPAGQTDGTAA